jgi:hypothetical protein
MGKRDCNCFGFTVSCFLFFNVVANFSGLLSLNPGFHPRLFTLNPVGVPGNNIPMILVREQVRSFLFYNLGNIISKKPLKNDFQDFV